MKVCKHIIPQNGIFDIEYFYTSRNIRFDIMTILINTKYGNYIFPTIRIGWSFNSKPVIGFLFDMYIFNKLIEVRYYNRTKRFSFRNY